MSDEEIVEQQQPENTEEPVKKSGKGTMSDKKLDNLAKARAARKANLEAKKKKYPVSSRPALEKKIAEQEELEKRIEEEAERKALAILERQKQEAELAEYREWKKNQEQLQKEQEATPAKATKKKATPKPKATTAAVRNPKPKVASRKPKKQEQVDSDTDESWEDEPQYGRPKKQSQWNSAPTNYNDWLDGVL